MIITTDKWGGTVPKIMDPVLLPPEKSQVAQNCRFDKGGIVPLKKDSFVFTPTISRGPILSIYPYKYQGNTFFFAFAEDVDVSLGPIANDSYDRAYYTEGGILKTTDHTLFSASGVAYPMSYYLPSPPAPTNAPVISGTPSGSDPTLQETRFYVYTYVNSYGEEGPPSPSSNKLVVYDGNAVSVASMDTGPSDPLYKVTLKRIYRINQGSGASAIYQFVAEIAVATATYSDTVADAALAEPLPSAEWDGAPDGIRGLIALPNSTFAGFVGNLVCFSVPQYPHAWPVSYQKPIEWPVVALGSFGVTLVALTTGQPYAIPFTDPANATPEQISRGMSCMSKRGTIQAGNVVVYPCPEGLGAISQNGADLITKDSIDKDKWNELYNPSSINAYYWQAKYVGFYTKPEGTRAGFMFDLKSADFIDLDFSATAGYHDAIDGQLYLQIGDDIMSFNNDAAYRDPKWTSKRFMFRSTALGVIKAVAKSYPVTVDITYPDIPLADAMRIKSVAARYPNGAPNATTPFTDTVEISSPNPERLIDIGIVEKIEFSANKMDSELSAVMLATTPEELLL